MPAQTLPTDRWLRYASVLLLTLGFSAIALRGQTFSPPLQLTDAGLSSQMAVDANGNINVAWRNLDLSTPFDSHALFTRSTDHGVTFSAPKAISGLQASGIQIAADSSGAIHFVEGDAAGIFYSRSTDGGATFSTSEITDEYNGGPLMDVGISGSVNIVWLDSSNNCVLSRSTDGGTTFSQTTVWSPPANSTAPSDLWQIKVDSNEDIHVVFNNLGPAVCDLLVGEFQRRR